MPCHRKRMTAEEAPHEVSIKGKPRWKEAQDQMCWLQEERVFATGFFYNSYDAREDKTTYRFTDPNTAFMFRMRW